MKKILMRMMILLAITSVATISCAQDKSKRPSPPATVTQTLASGAEVSIHYSQPSVKGRTIGVDLEPKAGEVWRTGANEATVFETSKDLRVEGNELPAGKYGLFSISDKDGWVFIFNKVWNQWGAYDYKAADDVLRITVKPTTVPSKTEKLTFTIDKSGEITLLWGDIKVGFTVQ